MFSSGASSTPRMEPFASGQIFNVSHLDRVHVLPPAHPSPAMGNVVSTNSKSTLVPTILKSVSRNPSSLSTMQPADKDSRYVNYCNMIIQFWLNKCAQPKKFGTGKKFGCKKQSFYSSIKNILCFVKRIISTDAKRNGINCIKNNSRRALTFLKHVYISEYEIKNFLFLILYLN